jgi:hypothetical protein
LRSAIPAVHSSEVISMKVVKRMSPAAVRRGAFALGGWLMIGLRWFAAGLRRVRRFMRSRRSSCAARLLRFLLAGHDPTPFRPPPAAMTADLLQATVAEEHLGYLAAEDEVLSWPRYAYLASQRLADHPDLGAQSADIYERIWRSRGLTADVVKVCRAWRRAHLKGVNHAWAVRAPHEIALALHADGQCRAAAAAITDFRRIRHAIPQKRLNQHTVVLAAAVIAAGCGDVDDALNVLRDNASMLPPKGTQELAAAARWLATVEAAHPAVCELQALIPTAVDDDGVVVDRPEFWQVVLDAFAPTVTGQRSRLPPPRLVPVTGTRLMNPSAFPDWSPRPHTQHGWR